MAKRTTDISGVSKELSNSISEDIRHKSKDKALNLDGLKVALSVSESENSGEFGFSELHQKDITIEITRYLLANGAHLIYGGDLRKQGYTFAFSELAHQYAYKQEKKVEHFTNFFFWPIYLQIKKAQSVEFKKYGVKIAEVKPPTELPKDISHKFLSPESIENKYYWASSISKMRSEMNKALSARVLIGGKINKFLGFYPGIIEEAFLAVKDKKPIYLVGCFGGASKILIDSILSTKPSMDLKIDRYCSSADYDELTKYAIDSRSKKLLWEEICTTFEKFDIKNLSKINGLNEEENKRLFETTQFHEIIYLILKGLKKINKS